MSRVSDFQKKVYATLDGALAVPVMAHPKPGQALPYVLVGESQSVDSPVGEELFVDVHVWSKKQGPHEVRTHQQTIYTALHNQTLTEGSSTFTCIRQDDRRDFVDENSEVWHGVQTFRCLAE